MSTPPWNKSLKPAEFSPSPERCDAKVTASLAKSESDEVWFLNSAITATPLRSERTIIVRLEKLKRSRPVQIILTTLPPWFVYHCPNIQDLCFSYRIETLIPEERDEVAITLTRDGDVYISHNNRGWTYRRKLDANLGYRIAYNMEHVSVMRMVGMATGGILPDSALISHRTPEARSDEPFRTVVAQLYSEVTSTDDYFDRCISGREALVGSKSVRSEVDSSLDMDFVGHGAFLQPDQIIIVRLVSMKKSAPVQMVLTPETDESIRWYGDLSLLCESTPSFRMESHIPLDGDELAVTLTRSGAVYISHNNRIWTQRLRVDLKRTYRILYSMQYVSCLEIIGTTASERQLDDIPAATGAETDELIRQWEPPGKNFALESAFFHRFSSRAKVTSSLATSDVCDTSQQNFAVTHTVLKANQTILVKLGELKQIKPIEIVLTTVSSLDVYLYGDLKRLCDETHSFTLMSLVPNAGDLLAVQLSSDGGVYISHNNRDWNRRIQVKADLEYHVIYSMETISTLFMVGMTSGAERVDEDPVSDTEDPIPDGRCLMCLLETKAVALVPCYHFVLCEECAESLQRTPRPRCPVCHRNIENVHRIYMS